MNNLIGGIIRALLKWEISSGEIVRFKAKQLVVVEEFTYGGIRCQRKRENDPRVNTVLMTLVALGLLRYSYDTHGFWAGTFFYYFDTQKQKRLKKMYKKPKPIKRR